MDNTQVELAALIARAWFDDDLKTRLEEDPETVFNELNLEYTEAFRFPARPEDLGVKDLVEVSSFGPNDCTYSSLVFIRNRKTDLVDYIKVIDPSKKKFMIYKKESNVG